MADKRYERVVAAALAETKSKFDLAEALAKDIPPKRRGPTPEDEQGVQGYLRDAREAIIDAGGEPRTVGTLDHYRRTALWVSDVNVRNFRWIEGTSFTAHSEARGAGMEYKAFKALKPEQRKIDALRKVLGHAGTDGPPGRVIGSWTPAEKAAAVRDLVSDPEVAKAALSNPDTASDVVRAARPEIARATADHDNRVREQVERGPHGKSREQAQTRIEVLTVLQRLAEVRISVSRLAGLGTIMPAEMEMLADEGKQTLASVQWLADLTPDQADLGDQVAQFLRSQS